MLFYHYTCMAKMSISSIQNNPLCADGARVPAKFHSDYLLKNALGMNFKIKEEELGPGQDMLLAYM